MSHSSIAHANMVSEANQLYQLNFRFDAFANRVVSRISFISLKIPVLITMRG